MVPNHLDSLGSRTGIRSMLGYSVRVQRGTSAAIGKQPRGFLEVAARHTLSLPRMLRYWTHSTPTLIYALNIRFDRIRSRLKAQARIERQHWLLRNIL
ncbi:hypothetical protein FOMPIDRAFT_1022952 [Fomitopsis schrenkii]|uniref:Uncharacterized protein n=1 Tax=Fomitopsis schrenkii TaxID=2126942 RepID=S8EFS5_FOMSC|nr:hypothetical protein FOMPIDRAFT_1022952 [Fomitopsis schrenkii]